MNERLFAELLLSVRQAGAILRGELQPERIFSYEAPDVKLTKEKQVHLPKNPTSPKIPHNATDPAHDQNA